MNFSLKKKQLPGTLNYTGTSTKPTTVTHLQYNKSELKEHKELQPVDRQDVVDWIIVEGLSDVDKVKSICDVFHVDSLVIEDILHVNQRTKVERYDGYTFTIINYSYLENNRIIQDSISFLQTDQALVTFTEHNNRFVVDVMERLHNPKSRIREYQKDYLFYVLLDMMVDEMIEVFHHMNNIVEEIELHVPTLDKEQQKTIYQTRKDLLYLRAQTNLLLPIYDKNILQSRFIKPSIKKFYNDVLDHLVNLQHNVVVQIENVKYIIDVFMNETSKQMNQIMTVLALFSAIFIPLSFLAGVFGMNFTNFPILSNQYGLLYFAIVSVLIPVLMILYFVRKGWFK